MSGANPAQPRRAPALQRFALGAMVRLYRLTNGAIGGSMGRLPVLLLTTTGRKSGRPHTIPITYFMDGETRFLVASNGGAPRNPAWYLNLMAHPQVELQIKGERSVATVAPAPPDERTRLWALVVAAAPMYARYQQNTTREIPLVTLRRAQ